MPQQRPTPRTPPAAEPPAAATYPGKTLGLAGLLLACTVGIIGVVVSSVALIVSLRHGSRNPAAVAGIIIGVVATAILIAGVFYFVGVLDGTIGACAGREPGVYDDGLMTYTCMDDE